MRPVAARAQSGLRLLQFAACTRDVQLARKDAPLQIVVDTLDVKIQADFPHGNGVVVVQP